MAVYRVNLLTAETGPVFDWLEANVERSQVVRSVAFQTDQGWYFKCVFKRREDAETFHRYWHPDATDHTVLPFGQPKSVRHNQTGEGRDPSAGGAV